MSNHDEGRRAFLIGTAIGAGAAASAFVPQALAQSEHEGHSRENASAPNQPMQMMSGGHGAFFNDDDARTIAAFCERLMPGEGGRPGATNANVLNYIDLALSGAYTDHQDFYRRGIAQLNAHCMKTYGKAFHGLTPTQQDETISALEHGKAPGFVWPTAQSFFETVRTHTMEGMFADPIYGGNQDFLGWQLVGFPGAQPLFTEADMHSEQSFTREPIIGLQARANGKKKG
jgi:gluconate 2-dehydrogenase gamma chain